MALNKDNILNALRKVGDQAAQAVGDLKENAKLNFEISSREGELADLYRELGRTTYEAKKNNLADSTSEALIAVIDAKVEELEEIKARKVELGAPDSCQNCGRDLDANVAYCAHCGAKVERPLDSVKQGVSEAAKGAKDWAVDKAKEVKDWAVDVAKEAKEEAEEVKEEIKETGEEIKEAVEEGVEEIRDKLSDQD
ncbi:MAG: zinc ribbon domain-containing protein [Clostridiales bacterium]|nr:zinc ribbon domain-containing protein [Clostridiales bacterium]